MTTPSPVVVTPQPVAATPPESTGYAPLREEFAHITQKMYSQNLALAQTNRTLSLLRSIDQLILEASRDLQHLSAEIARVIIDIVPYPLIGVLSLNRYNEEIMSIQGFAFSQLLMPKGVPVSTDYLKKLYLSQDSSWLASRQRNISFKVDDPHVAQQFEENGFDSNFHKLLVGLHDEYAVQSFYLTKLTVRNNLIGILLIGMEDADPRIDDIELLERLTEPTGIALDNRLLYEENQRFLQQLQISNNHLKELDKSKDEFIALVSHQLRTPLTSVKGFLSLVLDGDVGVVPDGQRGMLQQAYDSSQRMVYLIADLLNASRLRSGKFIIMNHETDLAELVATEVAQLTETARSRNIDLVFEKPTDIPKMMLDDTKIRQVVMNFLDNALYYTPLNGHIHVQLKATDTAVEYTVTDSGVGVPTSERPNLFTKFYRAANARKMRPEGTGLGLYMAKKVIVAQGGSIIFDSVENKGSTFGFSLPRASLEVSAQTPQTAPGEPEPNAATAVPEPIPAEDLTEVTLH